ncbi:hypothetical protein F4779DRAFT_393361 [Xylariaceae sp. FL0662B]|nr:hypothetical protein F4779DRAFT_393361 [Xylariaceae sp. FL0662B]
MFRNPTRNCCFSLERVAYFHQRSLDKAIPRSERAKPEWHYTRLFPYVNHVLSKVDRDTNRFATKEWQRDTNDVILDTSDRFPSNIGLRLTRAVDENMPAVVRGEITTLGRAYTPPNRSSARLAISSRPTYTFTDISGGFLEKAGHMFASHSLKMNSKCLTSRRILKVRVPRRAPTMSSSPP